MLYKALHCIEIRLSFIQNNQCQYFQNNNDNNNNNQKAKNNAKKEAEAKDVWCFTDDKNVKNPNNPKLLTIPHATCGYCSKLGAKR